MDSMSPKPRTLSIQPRTNRQSAKRKGKKKKEKKMEEGELWNVLDFGGMAGKKNEERMIKKKKVRVRVWRRKKEGKKRKKRKERNTVCGG